jgi:PAS domain S-box-containing protein
VNEDVVVGEKLEEAIAALRREMEERGKAEEAVRSAHRELEQIFRTATGGMRVVDMDFNVTRANGALARMAGRTVEWMVGRKCWGRFRGRLRDGLLHVRAPETWRHDAGLESKRTSDGRAIPCSVNAREMWDENGRLAGMVQDFRDRRIRSGSNRSRRP